ncbi:MAG TPA: ParB/RepB/Spo0J family partition protein [Gemmatimonadaceae bacterium]
MSAEKPRRLGKGLEALIASAATPTTTTQPGSDLQQIAISRVRANPFQPRREFDPAELAELEASLKATGLLQPISVRRKGDAFELIAGERRLRAATNLGWTDISAIVREFDDQTMLVLALVENLQRANLNAIEEGRGYKRLIDEFHLTQQEVADAVGKDRTTVTNLLRVLSLPAEIQQMVEDGSLSAGHARALLALGQQHSAVGLAKEAVAAGLSVRALEQRVRGMVAPPATPTTSPSIRPAKKEDSAKADPAVKRIEDDLRRYMQTDVRLFVGPEDKGRIEIAFYSNDDLDRILDLVLRESRRDF